MDYYSGTIDGKNVVLTKCGVGKISATIGTQIMISQFSPECIINTGTAGGVATGLKLAYML